MRERPIILLVDDTIENLQVLGEWLETSDYEVRIATNGDQALQIANSSELDLVLLDVKLPGLDGFEVCRALKKNPKTASLPVVLITGLDGPDERARAVAVGAADFVTKPFNLENVSQIVKRQLDR
jgi:CheY-like chemotaxis protein